MNVDDPLGELATGHFLVPREAFQLFLNYIVDLTGSTVGYLHLFDQATEEIQLNVWSDGVIPVCHTSHTSHYPLHEAGIWADSVRERRTIVHQDYAAMNRDGLPEGHFPVRRHASFPILEEGEIVAVLGIGNSPVRYSDETIKLAEDAIDFGWPVLKECLARIELDRHRALAPRYEQENSDALLGMIRAIVHALQVKDAHIAPSHPSNVSTLSRLIGEALGLDQNILYGLALGAYLHDIGKGTIDYQLLLKEELTGAERSHVQMHAAEGGRIFRAVKTPWPVAEMIAQHHERMDGSGYPLGLLGDMICLEARIIGVADTFDAIAAGGSTGRPGQGVEAAQQAIHEGRSTLFDPYVVDALDNVIEQDATVGGLYRD